MKKNGFTLIELLGVMIILALLMIIVFPSIINSIKSTSDSTEDQVNILIENATKLYINDNLDNYVKNEENTYCISITDLIESGNLTEETINASKNITLDDNVEVKYNILNNEYVFNISNECSEVIITEDETNIN